MLVAMFVIIVLVSDVASRTEIKFLPGHVGQWPVMAAVRALSQSEARDGEADQ